MAETNDTGLHVRPNETGVVRVFALELPPEQARFLREPGAAAQLLGVASLVDAQVDVIELRDLDEVGLSGYLTEGLGVPEADVATDRELLDSLTGWVMVVRSKAFGGHATTMSLGDGVRLVALLGEPPTDWSATPLSTDSAKPYSGARTSPREARSQARRIGFTWFAVVMTLIIAGLLWVIL